MPFSYATDAPAAHALLVLRRDEVEKAFSAFQTSRADDEVDHHVMREDFNLLHAQIVHENNTNHTMLDMFRNPHLLKRCALGFYVMVLAQGTATLVITS